MAYPYRVVRKATLALTFVIALAGCNKNPLSTVEPRGNAPAVLQFSVNPGSVRLDTIAPSGGKYQVKINVSTSVSDPDGSDKIASVQASVIAPDGSLLQSSDLHDDGKAPDQTAGDGIYSAQIVLSLSQNDVGVYQIAFSAVDVSQREGTSVIQTINIFHRSSPPWLSNVVGPDSVQIPGADADPKVIVFAVTAGDSSGVGDIKEVRLTVTGGTSPSIFSMADQNNIADKNTIDGELFTDTLRVDNTSFARTYTIHFQAIDRGGDTSATLSHTMVTYR